MYLEHTHQLYHMYNFLLACAPFTSSWLAKQINKFKRGCARFTRNSQMIEYINLSKFTLLHANSLYWTNRFLLSDTNNCQRGNSERNSLSIISQDYTNICHPLSFITAQRYSYIYRGDEEMEEPRLLVSRSIGKKIVLLFSLLAIVGGQLSSAC